MRLPGAVRPVQIYEELEARAVHGKQLELKNRWNEEKEKKVAMRVEWETNSIKSTYQQIGRECQLTYSLRRRCKTW